MSISVCSTITNLHDQELAKHGDAAFPIACYEDDLSFNEVAWHWHEEWEIVIVTEGELCFDMENTHQILSKGDGAFINSKALHAIRIGSRHTGKLHSAVFHPRLIGGNTDSVFWQKLVQPFFTNSATRFLFLSRNVFWQKEVLDSFEIAWTAIAEEQDDFENNARFYLSKAVRGILQNTDFTQSNLSESELTKINRIRSMMEFIELHYMEDLSVESLAESIAVSSSVVLRCFHEMLQTTPMQYVIQIRLRKAAAMLVKTRKSAKDIALDCGFNDASYFTKVFRMTYHVTPGEYRKREKRSADSKNS